MRAHPDITRPSVTHEDYVRAVRSMLGTPVVHMGRKPGKALDCVGVPWAACVSLGMRLAATPIYSVMPTERQLEDGLSLFCDLDPEPDRAHIWQIRFRGIACHVVVPIEQVDGRSWLCVHAWGEGRRVAEKLVRREAVRAWSIRGVARG